MLWGPTPIVQHVLHVGELLVVLHQLLVPPLPNTFGLTAAVGIIHRDCSCRPRLTSIRDRLYSKSSFSFPMADVNLRRRAAVSGAAGFFVGTHGRCAFRGSRARPTAADRGESRLAAAIPMANPYCSCKPTRVRQGYRPAALNMLEPRYCLMAKKVLGRGAGRQDVRAHGARAAGAGPGARGEDGPAQLLVLLEQLQVELLDLPGGRTIRGD